MTFLWHHTLWLLLALPLCVVAYALILRTRARQGQRYPGFRPRAEPASRWRALSAHAPALLLLCACAALVFAAARPTMVTTLPAKQGTVILLMDVSLSMAASDVAPTRLDAARAAAIAFVEQQPPGVRIGVVAFGAHADVVQDPTTERAAVVAALERLDLQRFTALGNGLIGALLTLFPTLPIRQDWDIFGTGRPPQGAYERSPETRHARDAPQPAAPGSYLSAAIVMVSDGLGTMGVPAAKAAQIAADLGIRVYTVGVGTLYGGTAIIEGWPPIHAEFAEETLEAIADATGGEYFLARTADAAARVYGKLGRKVVLERSEREVSALVTAIAALFSLGAAGCSLRAALNPAAG